jgi:dTDP-4-dehydrorhamnose 3,5-epimerase
MIVAPEPIRDDRGAFYRCFCAEEFSQRGLVANFPQISVSENLRAGTMRGLHLQRPPAAETKLIRVTAGAIWDVIVDVRANSETFGRWISVELSARNGLQLYVPQGFAHGFVTLQDATAITYHISVPYQSELQDGVVWNDPNLAIRWPIAEPVAMSERDRMLPPLSRFRPVEAAS